RRRPLRCEPGPNRPRPGYSLANALDGPCPGTGRSDLIQGRAQMSPFPRLAVALSVCLASAPLAGPAHAGPIRSGFASAALPANDDDSTALTPLGFTVNFFGKQHSAAFVNNNGNITFNQPLNDFSPFSLASTQREIIAPFFADVDTRADASGKVSFGQGAVDG